MPFNKPLIRQVRRFVIDTHPEAHNQRRWFVGEIAIPVIDNEKLITEWDSNICGSVGCIAGWGALMAGWHQVRETGYRMVLDNNGNPIFDEALGYYKEEWYSSGTDEVVDESGEVMSMQDAAWEAFGLDSEQQNVMFNGERSREQLTELFDAIEDWPDNKPSEDLSFSGVLEIDDEEED
jgi:hypothetical protein